MGVLLAGSGCFDPSGVPPLDPSTTATTADPASASASATSTDGGSSDEEGVTSVGGTGSTGPLDGSGDSGAEADSSSGSESTGAPVVCGDGIVDEGEACDDGNEIDTDACVACQPAACGDGHVQAGVEGCDDGNAVDTDACIACVPASCGDGYVFEGMEACDDGNVIPTDACTHVCTNATCGDGVLYEGVEECDDGNGNALDGCDNACVMTPGHPQCFAPYTELTLADRNQAFGSASRFCDQVSFLDGEWTNTGWYRFVGAAGTQMPEAPPPINSCGTHAPGWLNGAHPVEADGVVSRQVCFNWSGAICNWSTMIDVVACPGFYLYELVDTPACHLRYCGQ